MNLFELNNVSVNYGKGESSVLALKNVTLSIDEGETLAIVGKSGSGKTTLLNVLSGLEHVDMGDVLYDGKNFTTISDSQCAKVRLEQFGFVYQDFCLISSLSVYDNICLPIAARNQCINHQMLESTIKVLGLEDKLQRPTKDLSGGEKQRVAIARAIANKPKVIFADEPTGNLDSKNGEAVFELLFNLTKQNNITLIYVTHDEEKAMLAQRVIRLRDGEVVEDEKKDE